MGWKENLSEHPTPAEVYDLAVKHVVLLRLLQTHPEFHYLEPPTAEIAKVDANRVHKGLYFVADFVQNTYIKYILQFLPPGATRKCKELANPWAYRDPNFQWEWVFDTATGEMKDARGNVIEFPRFSSAQSKELLSEQFTRGVITQKIILENETDPKARALAFAGGPPFDFGEDTRRAAQELTK
ncbi:hypothetical protein GGR56DRAFT_100878 [Xylariaceae sp. FL0804]|nr:hypothetical protein GGR56DRAFT_100878 [Xylariaceae sp. FL0804]